MPRRPADTLSSSQGPGDGGLAQQRPQSAPIASRGLAGEEGLLAVQHSGRSAPPGAPILRVGAGTPLSECLAGGLVWWQQALRCMRVGERAVAEA